jgi:hypothetical protein
LAVILQLIHAGLKLADLVEQPRHVFAGVGNEVAVSAVNVEGY